MSWCVCVCGVYCARSMGLNEETGRSTWERSGWDGQGQQGSGETNAVEGKRMLGRGTVWGKAQGRTAWTVRDGQQRVAGGDTGEGYFWKAP